MDYGPIALVLALVVGGSIWWMVSRKPSAANKKTRKSGTVSAGLSAQQYHQHWSRIEQLMEQQGTESTKAALMEADKLVDTALKQKGFDGQSMGDRLKDARSYFGNNAVYDGLWQAHKMRNALAHELSFDVPKSVARQHLNQFKAALQQLRVM